MILCEGISCRMSAMAGWVLSPVGFQKRTKSVVAIGCKDEFWVTAMRHTVEWVKERIKSSVSRI